MRTSKPIGRRTTKAHTESSRSTLVKSASANEAERIDALARALALRIKAKPRIGIVLGSGLGAFANTLETRCAIPYAELPGMAASSVAGHAGNFVGGTHQGVDVCLMQGRVHLYEGHGPLEVVRGLRAMIALGVRTLILTNAAGGISNDFAPGDLMLIEDHLNLTGHSPLVGPIIGGEDSALGVRFPAMSDAYTGELLALTLKVAKARKVPLASGVYAGVLGPAYETPAEVRMLRTLGADAVGMSTVLETIAAKHMGASVIGLSCITNMAAGLAETPPNHAEVQAAANAVATRFTSLLSGVVLALAERDQMQSERKPSDRRKRGAR